MDITEILAAKRPNTRSTRILLEPDLRLRLDEAERSLPRVRRDDEKLNRRPEAPVLEAEIEELQKAIDAASVPFTFQALPRRDFLKLVDECPPRPDDTEDGFDFNPEELGPRLIAASALEPTMTVAQAEEIWNGWEDAVVTDLFALAFRVNKEVREVPFGKRSSDAIPSSTKSSTTALPEGSPTPSS